MPLYITLPNNSCSDGLPDHAYEHINDYTPYRHVFIFNKPSMEAAAQHIEHYYSSLGISYQIAEFDPKLFVEFERPKPLRKKRTDSGELFPI